MLQNNNNATGQTKRTSISNKKYIYIKFLKQALNTFKNHETTFNLKHGYYSIGRECKEMYLQQNPDLYIYYKLYIIHYSCFRLNDPDSLQITPDSLEQPWILCQKSNKNPLTTGFGDTWNNEFESEDDVGYPDSLNSVLNVNSSI